MGPLANFLCTKKSSERSELFSSFGGDSGDRTRDLLNAIQALSQLSYTPKPTTCDIITPYKKNVNTYFSFFQKIFLCLLLTNVCNALIICMVVYNHTIIQNLRGVRHA